MELIISVISDLTILLFNVTLYIKLTPLKHDCLRSRFLMYFGSAAIVALYLVANYVLHIPASLASTICMTIPSFLLFLCLAKYKSARFLVTFCFVDTVTFIIAAISRVALVLDGVRGGLIGCIILMVLCLFTYLTVRPYCPKYRELMERVSQGWTPMAVSTVFIYILLIFSAAYPAPLLTRLEYAPVYFFLCATILSFYWVFLVLLLQKAKLSRANFLLQQQQHWHDLAYLDGLTRLANHAAYSARIAELQAQSAYEHTYAIMVFDIDNFKRVNDTFGHHTGNTVLQDTANFFLKSFSAENYEFFRVGGDEFAAIVTDISSTGLEAVASKINRMALDPVLGYSYSCGYSPVDLSRDNAFEQAFICADRDMYVIKAQKKAATVKKHS